MTDDRGSGERRRRRPLKLTDLQLVALQGALVDVLDNVDGEDRQTIRRLAETARKVDAELDWRRLAGIVIVGRDPLIGTPATIIGPFRRRT